MYPFRKYRPSLDEIRQHPFFTMHQIPSSLPSSCTISAPIWSADEFGELHAIKPTSALDIPTAAAAAPVAKASAAVPKKAATGGGGNRGGGFNIYDDVNGNDRQEEEQEAVECKLDPRKAEVAVVATSPLNKLTSQMATCGVDDEARDMPPAMDHAASPEPLAQQQQQPKQATPPAAAQAAMSTPSQSSPPGASSAGNDDLHELVMMHSRLEECLANYERIQNGGAKVECPLRGGEVWGANKWVTRYVDYTSKYGLGFLLNDGSSGVYFNDSTKAVHSAEGDSFIYVERRKTGGAEGGVREPVSMYTVSSYPEDALKKKVTLLQHFRSYLLEQQKRAEEAGEAEPLTTSAEEGQGAAAPSLPAAENAEGEDGAAPLVFMKKWIKTKHAMLFRLSNGTVQVLFYDSTEVLISSEGNLITFVDKEKNRFVHSIAEIANKQHGDVSRRLKYAKEILAQLLSASSKR